MPLPRLHLFELEDLSWFPRTIRDLATDYLHFMATVFRLHKPVLPLLRRVLEGSRQTRVVDLCSGGGGPVLALYEGLAADGLRVPMTMTDKFPHLAAFARIAALHPGEIGYVATPVDASDVPPELTGVRTMFNAFHHFDPVAARAVLACAVRAGQPVCICEVPERSIGSLLLFSFTPLFVFAATPFMRPFRWDRLLWTYVVPLVTLTCWWDGLVSMFRAYTVDELKGLTAGLEGYDWTVSRLSIRGGAGHLTHVLGVPHAAQSAAQ
jgi:SAM-dependent methyltransferase